MLTKIHDTLVDPDNIILSYKTFGLHLFSGGSLMVGIGSVTDIFQLVGAVCLAISALMTVVINRKRYQKGVRELFNGCPDDEIQEK